MAETIIETAIPDSGVFLTVDEYLNLLIQDLSAPLSLLESGTQTSAPLPLLGSDSSTSTLLSFLGFDSSTSFVSSVKTPSGSPRLAAGALTNIQDLGSLDAESPGSLDAESLDSEPLELSRIIEPPIILEGSIAFDLNNVEHDTVDPSSDVPLESQSDNTIADTIFIPPTGFNQVDGLLWGRRWDSPNLTYSFPDSLTEDYGLDYERFDRHSETFSQAPLGLQNAVRQWLSDIASVVPLSFTEVGSPAPTLISAPLTLSDTDPVNTTPVSTLGESNVLGESNALDENNLLEDGGAVIRIAMSDDPNPAYAYLPFPSDEAGDVWFNNTIYETLFAEAQTGNYAWLTIGHELLHSIGLKHGHEEGGVAGTALPSEWDSMEFSIMTYRSYEGQVLGGFYTNANGHYAQSLMQLDILALQTLYGANFETQADDTVYTFDPDTGEVWINDQLQGRPVENIIFRTLWDGDGQDTYDFSAYNTPLSIDLNPGGISDLDVDGLHQRADLGAFDVSAATSDALIEPIYARGHLFNPFLFNDDPRSLIEHAIGGTASDYLLGNSVANQLEGGDGNDVLDGQDGNDLLMDGDGVDWLTGGMDADRFVLAADGERDVITDFDNVSDTIDISAWAIADVGQISISASSIGTQLQFQQEILTLEGVDATVFDSSKLIGFAPLTVSGLSPLSLSIAPLSLAPLSVSPAISPVISPTPIATLA